MPRGHYPVSRQHQSYGGGDLPDGCTALLLVGGLFLAVMFVLVLVFGSDATGMVGLLWWVLGAIVIGAMIYAMVNQNR